MVRLLTIAVIALGVWYAWRVIRRQSARVAEALKEAEGSVARKKTVELEKDPETGVYRPSDRRE